MLNIVVMQLQYVYAMVLNVFKKANSVLFLRQHLSNEYIYVVK